MKKSSCLSTLLATFAFILCATPALSQEFLNPVATSVQKPTFLDNGTVNSGGASGAQNHTSSLPTMPGCYNAGVVKGRQFGLPMAGNGIMAPGSVNMAPIPSGSYNFGFTGGGAIGSAINHYGMYGGHALPVCSTGSVDLNVVDCPNVASNYGPGQVNPYAISNVLQITLSDGTIRNIDFQETQEEASAFLQQELEGSTPLY